MVNDVFTSLFNISVTNVSITFLVELYKCSEFVYKVLK